MNIEKMAKKHLKVGIWDFLEGKIGWSKDSERTYLILMILISLILFSILCMKRDTNPFSIQVELFL